jgi:hypothetical protein
MTEFTFTSKKEAEIYYNNIKKTNVVKKPKKQYVVDVGRRL